MEKLNEVAAFLDRNPGLADCVVQITYSEMYDIAEAFRDLEQENSKLRQELAGPAKEAKLAELAKQKPLFKAEMSCGHCLSIGPIPDADFDEVADGIIQLYEHPVSSPTAILAELVPDERTAEYYYENYPQMAFSDVTTRTAEWNACRAEMLRNIGEAK